MHNINNRVPYITQFSFMSFLLAIHYENENGQFSLSAEQK